LLQNSPITPLEKNDLAAAASTDSLVCDAGRWALPYGRKTEKLLPDSPVMDSSTVSESI